MRSSRSTIGAALLAGSIAIGLNTALLAAADWIPLITARGGLLKLLTMLFSPYLSRAGVGSAWVRLGFPVPGGTTFQFGFHIVVGLAMAMFYSVLLETRLPGRPWWKGLLYAAGVWIANAFIVLPLLGEGVAGSRNLGALGITYYAAAHTVFFVLLAVLYARFNRSRLAGDCHVSFN